MKKRVAIVCPANYPVPSVKGGAVETLIETFIRENEEFKEFDIILYSYFDKQALEESEKYDNTQFVYIKINRIVEKVRFLCMRILRKIFKIEIENLFVKKAIIDIKKKGIKNIIVEGNKGYVLQIKKSIQDSNIYLHIHHEAFSDNCGKNNEIAQNCKKIIAVSDFINRKTNENIVNDEEKVVTIKNCVDVKLFNKEKYLTKRSCLRKKYGISDNEKVILFTGRILEIKGIKELVLAFRNYCRDLDAKLLIVGDAGFGQSIKSEYDEELIKLSKGIEDKIVFTGFIHNSVLPEIHSIADIAVVPSIWDEPAGLVVIEAMSSGLPLIVTNVGGISEYANSDCAVVLNRDDYLVDNLGRELLNLINNDSIRINMSNKAREHALQFNTTKYYKDLVKILNE